MLRNKKSVVPVRFSILTILILTIFVALVLTINLFAQGIQPQVGAESAKVEPSQNQSLVGSSVNYLPMVINQKNPYLPIIGNFTAEADVVLPGESTTLSWTTFKKVNSVTLEPGFGDVTHLSSVQVTLTDTTVFTLIVENDEGITIREITVEVLAAPDIIIFAPISETINLASSTTLNWTIENQVNTLTLEPGFGVITGLNSVVISPTETTTYTLTAVNAVGTDLSQTTVTVKQPPKIIDFFASPTTINQGEETHVGWIIENEVDILTLEPTFYEDVTGLDGTVLTPVETITYTLTATNGAGSDSAQIAINVIEPPDITSFTASPPTISNGGSSTLNWTILNNPTAVTINQNIGDVSNQNNVSVSPGNTKTYTLSASNSAGTDTAQVTVTVSNLQSNEMVVFDWNTPITVQHKGFPWDEPPMENGNWVSPINYAGGTFYYRVEIFNQPVPQLDMKLQFCIWQFNNALETCGPLPTVPGTSGTVKTWSGTIASMWKLNGPLVWTQPRFRNGIAVKNGAGDPVSSYIGWNWNGEDPDEWYPLDLRFTVVVVEAGGTFSGWGNYIP